MACIAMSCCFSCSLLLCLLLVRGHSLCWVVSWGWDIQTTSLPHLGSWYWLLTEVPGSLPFPGVLFLSVGSSHSAKASSQWLDSRRKKAEAARLLRAKLGVAQYHFCHTQLVHAHCKASPDSKGGKIERLLAGKAGSCVQGWEDV